LTYHPAGGSQGWQAYEQLVCRSGGAARQSRAVDVFSYGLLLHYCLTGGQHPFGARYERDMNILQVRLDPTLGGQRGQRRTLLLGPCQGTAVSFSACSQCVLMTKRQPWGACLLLMCKRAGGSR
jgi:hypothetical protein